MNVALHTIELFAGVGMLGVGLRAGLANLGVETRTVCYLERESYPASVLAARMEDGALDDAPIWSDVCTFDARAWRGAVDCVIGGFPCQDLSVAGRRAGLDGKRSGLFYELIRIANDCGARFLFLENVQGLYSADGYSARCVCGWDHRWGGIDQHTKAWRGPGGCRDVRKGDTTSELAVSNIRRERERDREGNGQMAGSLLLDDHHGASDLLSCPDSQIHDDQARDCDRHSEGGSCGQRFVEREAQEMDASQTCRIRGSSECDSESQQEGSAKGSTRLDCPACGEPLGEQAGESVNGAFRDVLWELAANGFHAEWMCIPASEVGASHGRERWFCWAWRSVGNTRLQHQHVQQRQDGAEHQRASGLVECEFCGYEFPEELVRYGCPNCEGDGMAHPMRHGRHQGRPEPGLEQGRSDAAECGGAMAHTSSPRQQRPELGTTRDDYRGGAGSI